MKRQLYWIAPVILAFGIVPGSAEAQTADSAKHRADCRLAVQVIETGHPAPHTRWAWTKILYCDPSLRVRAYASAMQEARTATDVPEVQRALRAPIGLRDGELFGLLLDIAADKTATVQARVVAFMALAAIRDPNASPSYEGFIGGVVEYPGGVLMPRGRCSAWTANAASFTVGPTPMPADYIRRIEELAERVLSDRTEAADVRSAAACT